MQMQLEAPKAAASQKNPDFPTGLCKTAITFSEFTVTSFNLPTSTACEGFWTELLGFE